MLPVSLFLEISNSDKVEIFDKEVGMVPDVIADFTTPGESHFVWPSPLPLQTP